MSSDLPGSTNYPTRRDGGGARRPVKMAKPGAREKKKRKGRGWLIAVIVVLALGAGAVTTGWLLFEDRIREVLGWELPDEYEGPGQGEALITVNPGDTGTEVAAALEEGGVVMSAQSFYRFLLEEELNPAFVPGTFALRQEMTNQDALDALLNPANRVQNTVSIPEGLTAQAIIERLSTSTEISVEEFDIAARDTVAFGLPAEAPSIEGYLFPATYEFAPGLDAHGILQVMVDRMFQSLDQAGVAPEDRHRVLTIAAMIQREAMFEADFYKVSQVVQNRLSMGMRIEFDSTSQYGSGDEGSIWSTGEALDAENDYNTYVIPGLPIGPIASPGDVAIDAAINPEPGPWVYFVTVDLSTGQTEFNVSYADHLADVEVLRAWCRASDENRELCA